MENPSEPSILEMQFQAWNENSLDEKYLTREYLDDWMRTFGVSVKVAMRVLCKNQDELRAMYEEHGIGATEMITEIFTEQLNMLKGYKELLLIADSRLFTVACQAEDFDAFAEAGKAADGHV